ncbi:MAG: prepilin-type N-terminal cleavage/methylation domain-containing protein [bacterium]|nr:prepilin-type N-terminal cleavage/methylation domain-containing protein [bacterium]
MLLKQKLEKLFTRQICHRRTDGQAGFIPPHFFSKKKNGGGFTLIELMITFAIFSIITTVIIWENSKFNSSVLLTNLSYQIALTIRQAQVYGLSSKQAPGGSTQVGYGVFFDVSNSDQAKQFVLFADTNITGGNLNTYQSSTETISTTLIGQNNQISNICFKKSSGSSCYSDIPQPVNDENATIVFKRPNPEPVLRNAASEAGISEIKIIISPINNSAIKRCVTISKYGQISVKGQSGCEPY